jgi:hypothetical protein
MVGGATACHDVGGEMVSNVEKIFGSSQYTRPVESDRKTEPGDPGTMYFTSRLCHLATCASANRNFPSSFSGSIWSQER